ncbi:hypothetical protein NL676_018517 [Syzygium grande]|nr:hypothetical protein NL676_018517 [Syzygium grande]
MHILVHSGFFEQKKLTPDSGDAYLLNRVSELLLEDNPLIVAPFALAMLDPILMNPWHGLGTWFHNHVNPTPFEMMQGISLWRYADNEPRLNRFFNEGMASDARPVGSVVVNQCRGMLEGITSLVDVGGGTRTMANALSDEDGVKILKRCKEAINQGKGKKKKAIIIDMVMENRKEDKEMNETQFFFDMLMMIHGSERERNETEWAKLFVDAGSGDYKITPLLGLRFLIENRELLHKKAKDKKDWKRQAATSKRTQILPSQEPTLKGGDLRKIGTKSFRLGGPLKKGKEKGERRKCDVPCRSWTVPEFSSACSCVSTVLFVSIRVSSGEFVHLSGQESSGHPDPLIEGESRVISSLASVQVICEGHRAQTVVESRGAVAYFTLAAVASLLPWSTGPWLGYGSVASKV